jgi:D-apiose dehydrogenase
MAPDLSSATRMVQTCEKHRVPFFTHENWRWQRPIRKLKELLKTDSIGKVFKARVSFCSGFPVFDNQPFLAELKEFILTDIGSHLLDVCRFLFGEVEYLAAHTLTVNPIIKGEDVANVFMKMQNGISCFAEMSYASVPEYEPFPQTFILIEGDSGSIELTKNFSIHVTTKKGTSIMDAQPENYPWADPAYALVHASIVACNRDLLQALQGKSTAETTGTDNLETVRLVHASYASSRENKVIAMRDFK